MRFLAAALMILRPPVDPEPAATVLLSCFAGGFPRFFSPTAEHSLDFGSMAVNFLFLKLGPYSFIPIRG